jgi:hypothetical protein
MKRERGKERATSRNQRERGQIARKFGKHRVDRLRGDGEDGGVVSMYERLIIREGGRSL